MWGVPTEQHASFGLVPGGLVAAVPGESGKAKAEAEPKSGSVDKDERGEEKRAGQGKQGPRGR